MSLYDLRKKIQDRHNDTIEPHSTSAYRNCIRDIDNEIELIESRVSQLEKNLEDISNWKVDSSVKQRANNYVQERIDELRGVLGE